MIIRTFRDVELELRKLKTLIDRLISESTRDRAAALSQADVIALIKKYAPRFPTTLEPISGVLPDVGRSTNVEYTLTANTTIPSPYLPTEADFLTIYVTQGAGPYTIAFDSQFAAVVNTNIPGQNGVTTVFFFRGRSDGLWWPVAAPTVLV